jgi:hypothetical protein
MAKRAATRKKKPATWVRTLLEKDGNKIADQAARLSGLKLTTYAKLCLTRAARSEVQAGGAAPARGG